MDVKYVPSYCVVNGKKYYQYTAIDECTIWTYRKMYDEHSTYSSLQFLINLVKKSSFPIREIQMDNWKEWTKALISSNGSKTLFENQLEEYGILYNTKNLSFLKVLLTSLKWNGIIQILS